MSWKTLPHEVLEIILRNEIFRTKDLAVLARLDKKTFSVVLPILYGQVVLRIYNAKSPEMVRFRRTICASPALAALTSVICFQLSYNREDWCDDLMADSIQRIRSLQELHVDLGDGIARSNTSAYDTFRQSLTTGTWSNLRVLGLHGLHLSLDEVLTCLCFPSIDTLKLSSTRLYRKSGGVACGSRQSLLKTFEIRLTTSLIPRLLDLLSFCQALECFSFRIIADCDDSSFYDDIEDEYNLEIGDISFFDDEEGEDNFENNGQPVQDYPATIFKALTHCQRTLARIDLYWEPDQRTVHNTHYSSVFNPVSFPNLNTIDIQDATGTHFYCTDRLACKSPGALQRACDALGIRLNPPPTDLYIDLSP